MNPIGYLYLYLLLGCIVGTILFRYLELWNNRIEETGKGRGIKRAIMGKPKHSRVPPFKKRRSFVSFAFRLFLLLSIIFLGFFLIELL